MFYMTKLLIVSSIKNWNPQYNACLTLTKGIRAKSKEKIYQELSLKPLRVRRGYKKLFHIVLKSEKCQYLFNLISARRT